MMRKRKKKKLKDLLRIMINKIKMIRKRNKKKKKLMIKKRKNEKVDQNIIFFLKNN